MAYQRRNQKGSRLSVVISTVLHALIIAAVVFLAAREGMLGKQMKKIAVTMVPKEKPPEPKPEDKKPEEKREEKPEEPKPVQEPPKVAVTPPPTTTATPPPSAVPAIAPPAAMVPSFDFEGGRAVETSNDPKVLYKGVMEYTLRSNWQRPEGASDLNCVVEVEVGVDSTGRIVGSEWKKGSGDLAWDNSVKQAIARTPTIGRKPPKGFPEKVIVRFDVQQEADVFAP
jgi:outer membrane biosynthesis protein TonB